MPSRSRHEAKPYTDADFRQEIPEAVCGGEDAGRVVIGSVGREAKEGAEILTAEITLSTDQVSRPCPRKASVRYVFMRAVRYRLMMRAPEDTLDKLRPIGTAFFASFKPSPE